MRDAGVMTDGPRPAGTPWQPLTGVRVADFSQLFPGPFATTLLGDLGADVIKIEPPTGDPARTILPEVFAAAARNKRSVVLDLKHTADRAEVPSIARWADVVIEGFRPGVAQRLGLGYDDLLVANSRLVYCSLSGYGQDGPWRDRPGHDLNYLAAGGALAYSAMYGRTPGRTSLPLADLAGGALAANAILAALRERDRTGAPARIDLSLYEATLYCATLRHGTTAPADSSPIPGNDLFETADGSFVTLALVEDHFWRAFTERVGAESPRLSDSRFATLEARRRNGSELSSTLQALMRTKTAAQWQATFAQSEVPFELCITPAQAVRSGHAQARGRVVEVDGTSFVPFPATVDGASRPVVHSPAPRLGEHTRTFMQELKETV